MDRPRLSHCVLYSSPPKKHSPRSCILTCRCTSRHSHSPVSDISIIHFASFSGGVRVQRILDRFNPSVLFQPSGYLMFRLRHRPDKSGERDSSYFGSSLEEGPCRIRKIGLRSVARVGGAWSGCINTLPGDDLGRFQLTRRGSQHRKQSLRIIPLYGSAGCLTLTCIDTDWEEAGQWILC